jgi:hypothetical protein
MGISLFLSLNSRPKGALQCGSVLPHSFAGHAAIFWGASLLAHSRASPRPYVNEIEYMGQMFVPRPLFMHAGVPHGGMRDCSP